MESKSLINPYATPQICDAVYKNQYTSEKIASMTPEEQTPMRIFAKNSIKESSSRHQGREKF